MIDNKCEEAETPAVDGLSPGYEKLLSPDDLLEAQTPRLYNRKNSDGIEFDDEVKRFKP
jgi:hypothetical protein